MTALKSKIKNPEFDTIYQVVSVTQHYSTRTHSHYWEIQLQDILTEKFYKTYADSSMRNFNNWHPIIENRHNAQLITAIRPKKNNIIDADSRPDTIWVGDTQVLNEKLSAWRSQ